MAIPGVSSGTCDLNSKYKCGDLPVENTSNESWLYSASHNASKHNNDLFSWSWWSTCTQHPNPFNHWTSKIWKSSSTQGWSRLPGCSGTNTYWNNSCFSIKSYILLQVFKVFIGQCFHYFIIVTIWNESNENRILKSTLKASFWVLLIFLGQHVAMFKHSLVRVEFLKDTQSLKRKTSLQNMEVR
jgi:hypothetical protein